MFYEKYLTNVRGLSQKVVDFSSSKKSWRVSMFVFYRNLELSISNKFECINDNQNQKESFLWSFYLGKVRITGTRKKWK